MLTIQGVLLKGTRVSDSKDWLRKEFSYLSAAGFFAVEHIGLCRMPLSPFTRFLLSPMLLILRQMWFSVFSV